MPQFAVVRMSTLARWKRWDAGFHVLYQHHGRAAEWLWLVQGRRGLKRAAKTLPRDQKLIRTLSGRWRENIPAWKLDGIQLSLYVAVSLSRSVTANEIRLRTERLSRQAILRTNRLVETVALLETHP